MAIAGSKSVPAEYIGSLQPPGKSNQILRPSAIYIDTVFQEVFVADPGNNRIVIFDSTGIFRHEFSGGSHFSTPVDISVTPDGYIWVLGSHRQGRSLFLFDFDGLYLSTFEIPTEFDGYPVTVSSFDLDKNGHLYLLDHAGFRVLEMDSSGTIVNSFEILDQMDKEDRREQVVGRLRIRCDRVLIPSGSLGAVYMYDTDGNLIFKLGRKGNDIGQLNFPVAATISSDSILLVLDKHRYNVVCFTIEGKFLGEFGGRGSSPGWFYHPTLLEIDKNRNVYIGQIFNSKLQVCRLPGFIRIKEPESSASNQENPHTDLMSCMVQVSAHLVKNEGGATKEFWSDCAPETNRFEARNINKLGIQPKFIPYWRYE